MTAALPLIENDLIFALLDGSDPRHGEARAFFVQLREGKLRVGLSCVALLELELVYMSNGLEQRLAGDLQAVSALPGVDVLSISPDEVIYATYLRGAYGLSFYDSHYAATALVEDGVVISYDQAYDKVQGLRRIDPSSVNFS